MQRENSQEYLAALGWLTICWGQLEAYVDLISAYLSQVGIVEAPPRAFNARIKTIRNSMKHFAFTQMREDMFRHLDRCVALSRERNNLIHGIVTRWEDGQPRTTHLRNTSTGYLAILDVENSVENIEAVSEEIRRYSCLMFGWLERIKSVIRLSQGREDFIEVARLNGDRN